MTATVVAGWETASSIPLRSVIAPRRAGTMTCAVCWVAAALRSASALHDAEPAGAQAGEGEHAQEDREEEADPPLDQPHALSRPALRSVWSVPPVVGTAVAAGITGAGVAVA